MPTRVLVPSGVLGLGFNRDALGRGIDMRPDIIAIDGGSTDSGPFYLGAGVSKYSRSVMLAEWTALMEARAEAGVPLVLTSAGTCGTDACVDRMLGITREAAVKLGQSLRIATVKSSQKPDFIVQKFDLKMLHALADAPALTRRTILDCANIVALAGAEQICAAIETGAEIIIAGRATDTAGIAALPLLNGDHSGAAWHGAKTAECGALCSTQPMSGVICVDFDDSGFEVEPLAENARCTPHTVSAHMLYENADPFLLKEPGGELDVSKAKYAAVSRRRVRVSGSIWNPSDRYTVKLEGARLAGWQSVILVIVRNERYVRRAAEWIEKLHAFLKTEILRKSGISESSYDLDFRLIGMNAALGALESRQGNPCEVGILCLVTAPRQDTANEIAKLINPYMLHFPLTENEELPTFAFPFSPAETERGPVYEFCLNHVMEIRRPMDAFKLELQEIRHAPSR